MGSWWSVHARAPRCEQCDAVLPVPKNTRRRRPGRLCGRCRRLADDAVRERVCTSKNAYPTAAEALRAGSYADPTAHRRLRPYPCPYADHFHLTSR